MTVSIDSINDAPRAFNDAVPFLHANNPLDPATIAYTSVLSGSFSVLTNGIDHDGGTRTVYDLNTSGTAGTIDMNYSTGTFIWSGPKTFFGQSSFLYRTSDGHGAVSDWVTVKKWANEQFPSGGPGDPPPPSAPLPLAANPDDLPVGDDPETM